MGVYFESFFYDLLVGTAIAVCTGIVYMQMVTFTYWQRRGVQTMPTTFPFGNYGPLIRQQLSFGETVEQFYHQTVGKFIGAYALGQPVLIVRDPQLLNQIFNRDFAHFTDRTPAVNASHNPMGYHIFTMQGEEWKQLRSTLTPAFTSGKLKAMFSTILACGDALQNFTVKAAAGEEVHEMREIGARYTTDVIASVAFGLETNTVDNPNTPFRVYGRKIFEPSFKNAIRFFVTFLFADKAHYLNVKAVDSDVEEFIMSTVRQTKEYRLKNNATRKDLFQIMLQLHLNGSVQSDGDWEVKSNEKNTTNAPKLTITELTAQMFAFYAAAFETSSSTISFVLFELAKNPDVQRKVQAEIDQVLARHNNVVTYDAVAEMTYFEACIDETLRKHPPVPMLNRECTREYRVPDTDVIIERGTAVVVPVLALHRDPKYYSNPMQFQPERFLKENSKSFVERPYMPFGEGARICIGLRMAKLQVKIGVLVMLQKCTFELVDEGELKMDARSFFAVAADGVNLRFKPRQLA